jgi:hypothetical protein
MNISTEVIRDLLPAYVAGEASADTRAIVESALASDADLRAEATNLGTVPAAGVTPPADLGLETLKRTQRLLRRRALLAGFSVFFSTFPLVIVYRSWGLAGRLGETACLLGAAAGWALFLKNAARLQVAGLTGTPSPHAQFAWSCAAQVFATSMLFTILDWTSVDLGPWTLGILTLGILLLFLMPVYWIGRRLGQLPASSEIQEGESLIAVVRDPDAHV